jgi:hypothetical protein
MSTLNAAKAQHQGSQTLLFTLANGAVVGAIAGVAMAGWAMVTSLINGNGFITPVQLIAATFFGEKALTLTPLVFVSGLMLHMATSMTLGAILGPVLSRPMPLWASGVIGILWGVAAWALFTFVIMPQGNVVMHLATDKTPIRWFIGHVIFGAVLGFMPISLPRMRSLMIRTDHLQAAA